VADYLLAPEVGLKSRLSDITFVKTIAKPAALTTPINAAKNKNILFF
jgi:hypothetical protein